MSKFSILTRLSILSAALLAILVASNLFLDSRLSRNAETIAAEAELVSQITTANAASKSFGDLKYWLADLAVSLLTLSERNADAARARLEVNLDELVLHEPDTVAVIREELELLVEEAQRAIDAYTDDQRVIGNSLMAQARVHTQKIDQALIQMVERLDETSRRRSDAGLASAREAVSLSHAIIIVGAIVGLLLTFLVLRSIRRPLSRLVVSMRAITAGDHNAAIPPGGPDEIGEMARTLVMFRDSLAEQDRLTVASENAQAAERRAQVQMLEAVEAVADAFALYDADDRLVISNSRYRDMYSNIDLPIVNEIGRAHV